MNPNTHDDETHCDDCGSLIEDGQVIGCPDGAEVCQDCFDAGRH
jgi:hypothetical protein